MNRRTLGDDIDKVIKEILEKPGLLESGATTSGIFADLYTLIKQLNEDLLYMKSRVQELEDLNNVRGRPW